VLPGRTGVVWIIRLFAQQAPPRCLNAYFSNSSTPFRYLRVRVFPLARAGGPPPGQCRFFRLFQKVKLLLQPPSLRQCFLLPFAALPAPQSCDCDLRLLLPFPIASSSYPVFRQTPHPPVCPKFSLVVFPGLEINSLRVHVSSS